MCACASNQASTCALLLSHHADITTRNDRGMTVFHLVAFLGSSIVLRELLSSASIDDEQLIQLLNQGDQYNQTPLFYACIEGHTDIVLTLIHAGANPYHLDDDHQTCLHAMLNSSIILKRHIYLFYRLIQLVDFRFYEDRLKRTLLDMTVINRYQTLTTLLNILKYKKNSNENQSDLEVGVLTLRQISILKFKRSIIYRHCRQENQEEILRRAFEQTFNIHERFPLEEHSTTIQPLHEKISDDLSILQQTNKYQKNAKTVKHLDKKLRKTASIFPMLTSAITAVSSEKWSSQIDLPRSPTHRSNSQRSLPSSPRRVRHPMENLVRIILRNEQKLFDFIDFPSLNGNPLLDRDIQWSIENYKLLDTTSKSN